MSRLVKLLLFFALAVVLAGMLALAALFVVSGGRPLDYAQTMIIRLSLASQQEALETPLSSDTTPVRFTVNSGDPPRAIAQNLFAAGLIRNADLFVDYVRVSDLDVELQAGAYFLRRSQSIIEIAQTLTDSRNSAIPFSIIEGWRVEEVAEAVEHNPLFAFSGADFLRVVGAGAAAQVDSAFAARVLLPANASLEGFLFPNTYSLPPDITPEGLRDILLDEFLEQIDAAGIPSAAALRGLTIYQAVTLASIVQREAVHLDEAPQIAGVYTNRLDIGMKLDADPTVQYPLGSAGNWWARITQADYVGVVSPYNTYLNTGLPPGPIANPGIAAIQAAVNPQPSEFYYFQAECSGSGYHRFARTFQEHLANSC